MTKPWIEDEPGLTEVARELRYIASRALARARWAVPLALLLSIAGALFVSLAPPTFTSRVVMKVTNDEVESGEVHLAAPELVAKLNNTVFTRAALLRVMKDLGLDPGTEQGRALALENVREEIDITVIQDYSPGPNKTSRSSTHIALAYEAGDAELALKMARALAGIVTKAESGTRREASLHATESVGVGAAAVRDELQRSESQQALLNERVRTLAGEERAAAMLELQRATRSARWQEGQLEDLEKTHSELSLRGEFDHQTRNLHFEVLDPGHLAAPPLLTRGETLALALVVLILFTPPWCGMLLGLIDGRVEDERQLRRLGLRPLGHIPPFRGYN